MAHLGTYPPVQVHILHIALVSPHLIKKETKRGRQKFEGKKGRKHKERKKKKKLQQYSSSSINYYYYYFYDVDDNTSNRMSGTNGSSTKASRQEANKSDCLIMLQHQLQTYC